jgi:hypothetical protein
MNAGSISASTVQWRFDQDAPCPVDNIGKVNIGFEMWFDVVEEMIFKRDYRLITVVIVAFGGTIRTRPPIAKVFLPEMLGVVVKEM